MIKVLALTNFRNFKKKMLEFSPATTVIVGPNASGKTNILEAIYLLSSGRSFKARVESEMIKYNSSIASITGRASSAKLDVKLTTGENGWPRKKLLVNGVPRRLIDFAGNLKIVLFGPWDLDLVTESPGLRRRFLDMVLAQVDREYRRASLSYEKGLRQRNRLLFRIREEGLSRSQLLFWNQLLIKNGNYISEQRAKFIEFANGYDSIFSIPHSIFQLEYDRSAISEARLEQYAEEEIAAATTLVGPHRDDFAFKSSTSSKSRTSSTGRDLARFGSRGEQRMGILWLKMAELGFIEKVTRLQQAFGEAKPTLLLDDIFSELDHEHRKVVMKIVKDFSGQVVITTADPHYVEGYKGERISVV